MKNLEKKCNLINNFYQNEDVINNYNSNLKSKVINQLNKIFIFLNENSDCKLFKFNGNEKIDIDFLDTSFKILDIESNLHYKHSSQDILNMISVNLIVDLINKSHYSFDEFKKIFIEQRHPFIIPKISNEDSWKYVELAMNKFKKNL